RAQVHWITLEAELSTIPRSGKTRDCRNQLISRAKQTGECAELTADQRAGQAALRNNAKNVSTLSNSAVVCWLSWPEAASTFSASARDWSADWLAPATLGETSLVPAGAW